MKQSLALRTSQSLALTPQLRLAIRVLRMSAEELGEEIRQALESNPLLDLDAAESTAGGDDAGDRDESLAVGTADEDTPTSEAGTPEPAEAGVAEAFEFDEPDAGERWDDLPRASPAEATSPEPTPSIDLKAHLWAQVDCLGLAGRDRLIAAALVDALDEDGYLREEFDAIRQAVGDPTLADSSIDSVRRRLLALDPTGVGARTLVECLLAQLDELPAATPGLALARQLVADHLELLVEPPERIARRLRLPVDECSRARQLVTTLDPKPGARYVDAEAGHVIPDLEVYRTRGRWQVRLVRGSTPRLRLDPCYADLVASHPGGGDWLRGRLQEARWLIRSIEQREETLLRVAGEIVDHQGAYFDFGPQAMRPLAMREVAERLGLHESTVSRAVAHKYLATPRGTVELRRFFPTGLATDSGGSTSSTAIQAMIRALIAGESRNRPLADQAIAEQLSAQGIRVARRTVAKYREALNIPPSHERAAARSAPAGDVGAVARNPDGR
jgi:RNA polymerase sigma-54 factor